MERPLLLATLLLELVLLAWAGLIPQQVHETILLIVLGFLVLQEFFDWIPRPGGSGGNNAQKR
jgi:hypothetical protein